jgi:hypothetical protein
LHPFDERLVELERSQHGLVALHQIDPGWKVGLVQQRLRTRRNRVLPRVFVNPSVALS